MRHLLSVVLFLPLAGALLLALFPKDAVRGIRAITLASATATFGVSLLILVRFQPVVGTFQMTESVRWIPSVDARYHLGVDGISLWLVLLTTLLMPLCVLASWKVTDRVKSFHLVLLVLETGILGVFLALDLLLFYVFWEGMLIPMYLLIGIWGYKRRVYAAVKFFLYTLTGSLLMLVGIVSLYFLGPHTFDLTKLAQVHFAHSAQLWLFAAFFASFAIKIPIFPFHTWLPDAHTEAPTAGSVLLAGVLLKMGAYGFLRFSFPLFPEAVARFAPAMIVLGVIGIVYGGLVSIVQRDIKRLVAYSSVSHLGFVVLGIGVLNQIATSGSVLQMINHGLTTSALFLLIGMLYQRAHTRQISELGGVNRLMPVFGGLFLITSLASLGLPGLNGFVGEFLILNGTFAYSRPIAIIATSGVVLAAVYLLWAYERIFTGPINLPHQERKSIWSDVSLREVLVVAPLVVMSFVIGIFPRPFLERIEPSVARLIDTVHQPTLRLAGK